MGTQERGVGSARNGPEAGGENARDFVQSFARGLSVIRAFPADGTGLTLSDVARSTGLPRAAARRFLLTLETLGYVRCTGRIFSLTPQVLELSHGYLAGSGRTDLLEAINTSIPNARINDADLRQLVIPRLMAPGRADAAELG